MQSRIKFAMNASLAANVLLLIAKIAGYFVSRSKAVLASTADSFVDIASQVGGSIPHHTGTYVSSVFAPPISSCPGKHVWFTIYLFRPVQKEKGVW